VLETRQPTTINKDASGFHTESSARIQEDKESWTYVTDNGSFHFAEVLGDKGTYEAVLLLEENYHNENTLESSGCVAKPRLGHGQWRIPRNGSYGGLSMRKPIRERY